MKPLSVTIQMKATEQYFPVVLFIMLYKVVLLLSLWMKFIFPLFHAHLNPKTKSYIGLLSMHNSIISLSQFYDALFTV